MKNLKLLVKLFIMVFITAVIPIIIITFIFIFSSGNEIKNQVSVTDKVFAELSKSKVENYFSGRISDSNLAANLSRVQKALVFNNTESSEADLEKAYKDLDDYFKVSLEEYGYTDIFMTDKSGNGFFWTKNKSAENFDFSDVSYIKEALSGKQNWSDIFYLDLINANIIVLATPVYESGNTKNIIGTLNIVISQKILENLLFAGIEQIGNTADSFLISQDQILLTNTNHGEFSQNYSLKQKINSDGAKKLADEIKNKNYTYSEFTEYTNHYGEKVFGLLSVLSVGNNHFGQIIEIETSESLANLNKLQILIAIIILIVLVFIVIVVYFMSKSITLPLKISVSQAKKFSEYNFRDHIPEEYTKRKDEIGELALAFETLSENLRNIIENIKESSDEINQASQGLASISEENTASIQELASQSSIISDNTENSSSGSQKINSETEELASSAQTISDLSKKISDITGETTKDSEIGSKVINKVTEMISEAFENSNITIERVTELNTKAQNIESIVSTINGITEQTNLLALNAAIEAARAGEAGKGFAVVADEIRKLTEESKTATQKIAEILSKFREDSGIVTNRSR